MTARKAYSQYRMVKGMGYSWRYALRSVWFGRAWL